MPSDGPHDNTTNACAICDLAIDDAPLTDAETGHAFHPKCVIDRLPQDAVIRLLGVVALIGVPTVAVWAA